MQFMIEKAKLKLWVLCCRRWVHKLADKGEHVFHISYLSLVGYEAHGHYRWAAVGLVCCIVLHAIVGEIDE